MNGLNIEPGRIYHVKYTGAYIDRIATFNLYTGNRIVGTYPVIEGNILKGTLEVRDNGVVALYVNDGFIIVSVYDLEEVTV